MKTIIILLTTSLLLTSALPTASAVEQKLCDGFIPASSAVECAERHGGKGIGDVLKLLAYVIDQADKVCETVTDQDCKSEYVF